MPDLPPADALRQARLTRQFARVEGGEAGSTERALKLRVIVLVSMDGQRIDNSRYLQLVQTVPTVFFMKSGGKIEPAKMAWPSVKKLIQEQLSY